MDKKIKREWLKALRSGEIKQGRGRLIDPAGAMCCLGVLGRICGIPDKRLRYNSRQVDCGGLRELTDVARLPREKRDTLAMMNDGNEGECKRPMSFKQIAAHIERYL